MATRGFRRHSKTPVCKLSSLSSSPPLFYTILSIKKSLGSFSLASWGSPFWDCLITEVTGCCFGPSAIFWEWGMLYRAQGLNTSAPTGSWGSVAAQVGWGKAIGRCRFWRGPKSLPCFFSEESTPESLEPWGGVRDSSVFAPVGKFLQ